MESDLSDKYPHKELTYKIIGALFKVHNYLGNSLEEKYYQRALAQEFRNLGLKFKEQVEVDLNYDGLNIGKHKLDFLIEDKIILEIKAIPRLDAKASTQLLAYLKSCRVHVGLLANFRTERLTYRRLVNPLMK